MVTSGRAVLSLGATCKELRRLLRPTAVHREARARRDTIIWPSLRVAESAPRTPGSASHLYSAQRQEEKHSKAQLKMMRSAISAFVCGTPRAALRRAFVEEQAEAGNHYRVRVIHRCPEDSDDSEVLLVSNGFLLRTEDADDEGPDVRKALHVHRYDDAAVPDHSFGENPESIVVLDNVILAPGGICAFDMVDVYSATGDMIVARLAVESHDEGEVMNVFYEHHRLNTTKGIVEEVFKTCIRSYETDYVGEWKNWPASFMLCEDGDPYAVTFSIDRNENGGFSFPAGGPNDLKYNIVRVHGDYTVPVQTGFCLMPWPPGVVGTLTSKDDIASFLGDWIENATASTLGVVAVSTLGGLRIHSGSGYGASEHINLKHKVVNEHGIIKTYWTPMRPIAFSENGQFLLAQSVSHLSGVPRGTFVLAREGTTGLFSRYPMAALRTEAPNAEGISNAVFTPCSRYCLFKGAWGRASRCWFYVDLHSVFEPVVPCAVQQSTLVAVGRPLAPDLGRQCGVKQPLKIRFGSGGVLVHCADESCVRFTVEGTEQNPKPPVPH